MKKFKFRLEKVLQYRSIRKSEAKRELALRMQELRSLEQHVQFLESEFRKHGLREGQIIAVSTLFLTRDYAARLKDDIEKSRKEIELAREKVKEAMSRYIEASKEEKALVTLKDKKLALYKEEADKAEQEFLDELTVQRAGLETPSNSGIDKE